MVQAFHEVNILTGHKEAKIIKDAEQCVALIKKAERPLIVVGSKVFDQTSLPRHLGEYAIELADALDMSICATANAKKVLIELGWMPESDLDFVEIINCLKRKGGRGVGKREITGLAFLWVFGVVFLKGGY